MSAWAPTWGAANSPSKTQPKKTTAAQRTPARVASKKATKKTSSKRRRYRKEPFKYRLARLKLQPERATEIQQALITQGYLKQEPTGKWDEATRDAMRRFQADHGFPTTGLPEARSLMKLGLGPHPLPEELDPTKQTSASVSPLAPPESNVSTGDAISQE